MPTPLRALSPLLVAGLMVGLPGGCGGAPCARMCEAAEARVEGCLDAQGQTWDDLGFAGVTDFRDFCAAWVEEARALDTTDACPDMETTFRDGTCAEWPAAFLGSAP
jgi:hypothetical protein